jgi:hypothetical protein
MPHRLDRGLGLVGNLKARMGDPGSLLGILPILLTKKFSIAGVGNLADTSDDVLFTTTITGKTLSHDGDGLVVSAYGVFAGNANNKTVKLIFGATTLVSSGVVALNGKAWWLIAEITRTAVATQLSIGEYSADTSTTEVMTKTAPGETLSADVVLKVTGASPTTGAANDCLCHGWRVVGLRV